MGVSAMSGIGEVTLATCSQLICFNSNGPLSQETVTCLNFIWKKLYFLTVRDDQGTEHSSALLLLLNGF